MNRRLYNKVILSIFLVVLTCLSAILVSKLDIETFAIKRKLPIYSVETEKQDIAITFDVNWAKKDYIYEILDILKNKNVKATFFVMGGWIEYNEENIAKLRRIYDEGHEIGNHSNMHPDMTKITRERMIKEIEVTDSIIKKHTGITTDLFRCPSGAYDDRVIETVDSTKHYCIQWDVDSIDWKEQGEQIEYERVIKKSSAGSIILFHNDAKYTPKNLEKLIDNLKDKGYNFVVVSELIYKDNYYIDSNGKQHKN